MFEYEEIDFVQAKKNLNRQATKVIQDIADAYVGGVFDDPKKISFFCNLLACICEGKIEGTLDENTMRVKWSLTPEYQKKMEDLQEAASAAANVLRGPW